MEKAKIIFDTDMGADCDDAAALALTLELMNAGECDLLAVTHCTMCESAGGCIESILNYYGHSEIPVGSFHPEDHLETREWRDVYATEVAMAYDNRFRAGSHYEDSVKLIRRILSSSADRIKLVSTGPLTTFARLLQSEADDISPLSGGELISQKVDWTVCMAGTFPQRWPESQGRVEWNILCDVPSARVVCENWPTELVFCSSEIGIPIITCGKIQTEGNPHNPVRTCFEIWHRQDGKIGRSSWDPATILYAVRPNAEYWELSERGRFTIDGKGLTALEVQPKGKHCFLIEKRPVQEMETLIDEILNRDLLRNP